MRINLIDPKETHPQKNLPKLLGNHSAHGAALNSSPSWPAGPAGFTHRLLINPSGKWSLTETFLPQGKQPASIVTALCS